MNINNGGSCESSLPGVPTHVYLLQTDTGINLSLNEQVLPLHLLDNSLDYCRSPFLSPLATKRRDVEDRLRELTGPYQEPGKAMGFRIEKSGQNAENQMEVFPEKSHSLLCDTKLSEILRPDIRKEDEVNRSPKNYVQILDRVVLPRALAVLPSILQIQRRETITARRTLPAHARFGPVQGIKKNISQAEAVQLVLNATSNKKPLFLTKNNDSDGNCITHIDTSDKDKSNWIGLLPLGDKNTANVWLYEDNNDLFAITTDSIPLRKPLMLGYSKKYADSYGLIGPTKDIEIENQSNAPALWCSECQRALPSAKLLQRHVDMYHKDDKLIPRRRYRCRHCSRTFSRLFSLRRHILIHCPNKVEKKQPEPKTESEPQINFNTSIASEDHRIPSDESFQNYSNGLDFSTNLFDTDRIPSLDISGNSRSDNDFIPYGIGFKDENTENDLEFHIKHGKNENVSEESEQLVEQLLVSCPYCKQVLVKENRRQHLSDCPGRRFECECKKVFMDKKKLAHHIYIQHSNESSAQNETENSPVISTKSEPESTLYKCEQCQHTFKRRGMLVNHLWRVHNTVSAKIPLERRVRHYPCGICPKIYRTAAKRDRHLHLHHPGAPGTRAAVEGGTRVCEPAACAACPRQYVTRAKLLQHQRAAHPHLAPPINTKPKSTHKPVKSNKIKSSV
ncbi:PR domain zinc finger protein 5-like isoform X2 [Trichoplusia ni]|uniref:PR domain zinc finger protein 5-like isoform X2 n=1 Tax=Trichoplusia ni TaxID=7111 RepID=A0A7E5VXQ2_TRINI|nr:PR domain zinc finger protein 5-like isoform X2 [Trichoplusia ni]